jgi:hypothetical protein
MGKTRLVKTTPVSADILKQTPETGKILLVRNIRVGGAISIEHGGRGQDAEAPITLEYGEEQTVSASWAKVSRDLKKFLAKDWVYVEWVDENFVPAHFVTYDDAPGDLTAPLNLLEMRFAFDSIARQTDLALALSAVNTKVMQPEPRAGLLDTRYMREHFIYVLKLAAWLEENIHNRAKIKTAIRNAIRAISDM